MANWYYYDSSGSRQGPVDSDMLKRLAQFGEIVPTTKVETEEGRQSTAGKIHGLEFGTSYSPYSPAPVPPPTPAPVPYPFTSSTSTPMPSPVTSIQYEYKCVAAPMVLRIAVNPARRTADEAECVESYGKIINRECYDRWEFYSMQQITVENKPGCFSFGAEPEKTIYNMLIFRRQK